MVRPKLGSTESRRLQMFITDDELEAIDAWRAANKVRSKSEAIRRLCQLGIELDGQAKSVGKLAQNAISKVEKVSTMLSASAARQPKARPAAIAVELALSDVTKNLIEILVASQPAAALDLLLNSDTSEPEFAVSFMKALRSKSILK